jgi:molecular chaperone GrpE
MNHRRIPTSNIDGPRSGRGASAASPLEHEDSPPHQEPESLDEGQPDAGPGLAGRPGQTDPLMEVRQPPEEAAARDQLLRLAAEFDNFRKREARERAEAWGRAKADLIDKLLPVLDDLRRVAHPEAAEAPPGSPVRALLEGVELVERKLLRVLEREGLQAIEAQGAAFDPALHEAILTWPTNDPQLEGRVAQVVEPGYRFAERLLRPAKVVVWKLNR